MGPTCLFNKKRILKTLSSLLGQIPLGHPLTHSLCCPSVKQQKAHPRTRGTPTRKSAGDTGPLPPTPSPRLFKYNPTIANHVADSWKSNLSSIFKPWGVLVAILGVLKRELGCHGSSCDSLAPRPPPQNYYNTITIQLTLPSHVLMLSY